MINKLTYYIALLVCIVGATNAAMSQNVNLRVANQVIQGQRFTVTVSVTNGEASISRDSAPKLAGCTLLSGPALSTMQSVQIVNGRQTSSVSRDYTFTYTADKAGTVNIPAIRVQVNGKDMSTQPRTLTILPPDKSASGNNNYYGFPGDEFDELEEWMNQMMGGGRPSRPQRPQPGQQDNITQSPGISAKDFLVTVNLSKKDLYEKEATIATIKLYTKHNITKFQPVVMPQFEGFLSEEIDVSNQQPQLEHFNGENYYSLVLKKCLLFPQKAGKLTINSGTYDVTLETVEYVSNGFYATPVQKSKNITTTSNSLSVNIKPLPTPVPASFNGAVGDFEVSATLSPEKLRTNEAARYTLSVKGVGNLKHLAEPIVPFPATVEEYTPTGESDAHFNGTSLQGTYTATYTFVPQQTGKLVIPGWQYTYFNPATGRYVTVDLPSFEKEVGKGIAGPSAQSVVKNENEDIKDILYISKVDEDSLSMNPKRIFLSYWYWLIYLVAIIALITATISYRSHIKSRADLQGRKTKMARSVASKRLKKAQSAMTAHNKEEFYAAVSAALVGFLSDKLKIPASLLTRDNIKDTLTSAGASDELTHRTIKLLDECEMARFTPTVSDSELSAVFKEASAVIDGLNQLKPKTRHTVQKTVKSRYEA